MTEQNRTSSEVWRLGVAILLPASYYTYMPAFTLISSHNAHWLICPWSTCPNKVHWDAQSRLEYNEKITSCQKHTEWQLRHRHSTRRNDDVCKPLALQTYLTFVPKWSRKNLLAFTWIHHNMCVDNTRNCKLKILQFQDPSWNWIIYFELTLVFKGLKWIPNHLLRWAQKKG